MNKLTAACMMFASSVALAAGFQLDVQGARATGMATAVTAQIDDPSAIYYNPAGIAGRKGLDAALGISLIIPMIQFTRLEGGAVTSSPVGVSPPPHLHLVYGITEQLAVGLGVYVPFGASGNWPANWEGRFKAIRSSLQTYNINPTVAYQVHPRLKVGLGIDVMRGTVAIERALGFIDTEGNVTLGGAGTGFGWNAGAQLEIVEKRLYFGATYRSAVEMKFQGAAHFSEIPLEFQARLADQPITANVRLPSQANFGFGVTPMDKLRLGLDFHYTEWTSFPELRIEFENKDLTVPLNKSWVDQVSVHVGGEYAVNKAVSVRAGFVYDPTPSPRTTLTPDLPDSSRIKVTAGVGWKHDLGIRVDFGYQLVVLTGADSYAPGFEGRYSGTAQVIALTVGYAMK